MSSNLFPSALYSKSLRAHPLFSMQKELSRLFDDFVTSDSGEQATGGFFSPRVDVIDSETELKLSAEIPGIEEKDIDLTIQDGRLVISGEKKKTTEEKAEGRHYVERVYGKFERVLSLPENVNEDAIQATFKNGVLEVHIPKREPEVPAAKKIEVRSAS
ncbi:MAG TPA: Hsp20/alpha crystallin family protein [Oligoflexia bacterium]|nr:Hsp20/alpha crystallin family protein [Oligoflexia bacterium]HMP48839.1 Hsp20/alpha crystallin family protein [Oligoflexia bacterium]